jgi:hypothetical protein
MARPAKLHARRDYRAGAAHLYRLMERLATRGAISALSWDVYRAANAEQRAPVGAACALCCA